MLNLFSELTVVFFKLNSITLHLFLFQVKILNNHVHWKHFICYNIGDCIMKESKYKCWIQKNSPISRARIIHLSYCHAAISNTIDDFFNYGTLLSPELEWLICPIATLPYPTLLMISSTMELSYLQSLNDPSVLLPRYYIQHHWLFPQLCMKNTYCLFQIKFITEYQNVQHIIITQI